MFTFFLILILVQVTHKHELLSIRNFRALTQFPRYCLPVLHIHTLFVHFPSLLLCSFHFYYIYFSRFPRTIHITVNFVSITYTYLHFPLYLLFHTTTLNFLNLTTVPSNVHFFFNSNTGNPQARTSYLCSLHISTVHLSHIPTKRRKMRR